LSPRDFRSSNSKDLELWKLRIHYAANGAGKFLTLKRSQFCYLKKFSFISIQCFCALDHIVLFYFANPVNRIYILQSASWGACTKVNVPPIIFRFKHLKSRFTKKFTSDLELLSEFLTFQLSTFAKENLKKKNVLCFGQVCWPNVLSYQ
jgi:hypothetical protein